MNDKRIDLLTSIAFYGLIVSGAIGIISALMALGNTNPTAAGVSVLGSGVSFGLMATALLRR